MHQTLESPTYKNIIDLGDNVRSSARYLDLGDPVEVQLHKELQNALISNPSHARYFADEIKREQQEVARYPTNTGPRVSYDFHRGLYFETLSLLPSPETITVLGDFLSDDIDTPVPLRSPDSDWGDNPRANSFAASFTIMNIGLRSPPMAKGTYDADPDAHLAKTRAWWEKVKSGELTFSFVGQKVEYRIKPDGTWDTIALVNPPDDGLRPPDPANRPGKHPAQATTTPASEPAPAKQQSWLWITAEVVLILSVVAWMLKKASRPAS